MAALSMSCWELHQIYHIADYTTLTIMATRQSLFSPEWTPVTAREVYQSREEIRTYQSREEIRTVHVAFNVKVSEKKLNAQTASLLLKIS